MHKRAYISDNRQVQQFTFDVDSGKQVNVSVTSMDLCLYSILHLKICLRRG